jgi:hypothetical protein
LVASYTDLLDSFGPCAQAQALHAPAQDVESLFAGAASDKLTLVWYQFDRTTSYKHGFEMQMQ